MSTLKPSDGPAMIWNGISIYTSKQPYNTIADEPRCELVIDPYCKVLLRGKDLEALIAQALTAQATLRGECRRWQRERRRRQQEREQP